MDLTYVRIKVTPLQGNNHFPKEQLSDIKQFGNPASKTLS